MLVPMCALYPESTELPAVQSQRCVWRADASEPSLHNECWERRECGHLRLLSTPAKFSIPSDGTGWYFEWTQARKRWGSSPPMIRLAVCIQVPGRDGDADHGQGQWFVSAVGDRKCHAYGAALEYFALMTVL